jgi:hypothetical protein
LTHEPKELESWAERIRRSSRRKDAAGKIRDAGLLAMAAFLGVVWVVAIAMVVSSAFR